MLIFEDDLLLHPQFRELAEALPLAVDWGIFYFGCKHFAEPEVVQPGVVRVTGAWTTHAYAVRRQWLPAVLRELRGAAGTGGPKACDLALTSLADRIPCYAAYPNLAWQAAGHSSIRGHDRETFTEDGHQLWRPQLLDRVNEQMLAICNPERIPGNIIKPAAIDS